jgi:RimJ/RimL family protein N-acetyltransferase
MQVLEGTDVDVIAPFPTAQWGLAARWLHCSRTLMFGDDAPEGDAAVANWLRQHAALSGVETYGIVDKHNLTKQSVPSLVGFIFFEPQGRENAYAHVASSRRAWGSRIVQPGLMEQGAEIVTQHCFAQHPALQRLSVACFANNFAAQNFAKRMGFRQDGFFRAMASFRSQPMDVVHFGRLRNAAPAVAEAKQAELAEVA